MKKAFLTLVAIGLLASCNPEDDCNCIRTITHTLEDGTEIVGEPENIDCSTPGIIERENMTAKIICE